MAIDADPKFKAKLLHDAVKAGDLATIQALLDADRSLVNAVSPTDVRGPDSFAGWYRVSAKTRLIEGASP